MMMKKKIGKKERKRRRREENRKEKEDWEKEEEKRSRKRKKKRKRNRKKKRKRRSFPSQNNSHIPTHRLSMLSLHLDLLVFGKQLILFAVCNLDLYNSVHRHRLTKRHNVIGSNHFVETCLDSLSFFTATFSKVCFQRHSHWLL